VKAQTITSGQRPVTVSPNAALTNLHGGANWLFLRLPASALERKHTSALSGSTRHREKSLLAWNCTSRPTTTSLKYASRIKRHSSLILSRASEYFLIWQIGQQGITNLYDDGDLFTADHFALKPELAKRF